jgi:hypothetical protein
MNAPAPLLVDAPPAAPKTPLRSAVGRFALHCGFLAIALAWLAAYAHFAAEGQSTASLASLAVAAGFGFLPVRDLVRVVFKVGGMALHVVHAIGGLALLALPLAGVVSGPSILTHGAMAPFAIMGAAQALMHSQQPRNAKQAAALRQFVASLPEVARIGGSKSFSSPENAARAVAALSDVIAKAQALGQTELDADPGFQSALRQVTTRFGANLGLDAIDMALTKLAANPVTARAVPALRKQLAAARRTVAGATAATVG